MSNTYFNDDEIDKFKQAIINSANTYWNQSTASSSPPRWVSSSPAQPIPDSLLGFDIGELIRLRKLLSLHDTTLTEVLNRLEKIDDKSI